MAQTNPCEQYGALGEFTEESRVKPPAPRGSGRPRRFNPLPACAASDFLGRAALGASALRTGEAAPTGRRRYAGNGARRTGRAQIRGWPAKCTCPPLQPQEPPRPKKLSKSETFFTAALDPGASADTPARNQGPGAACPDRTQAIPCKVQQSSSEDRCRARCVPDRPVIPGISRSLRDNPLPELTCG
jgi:hypothetical protein